MEKYNKHIEKKKKKLKQHGKYQNHNIIDIIIVGGGIAGYTSALYLENNNKEVVLFDGDVAQIEESKKILNFPSYKEISGTVLLSKIKEQVNVKVIQKKVKKVNLGHYPFKVIDEDDNKYYTYSIILTTGTKYKKLEIKNLEKYKKNVHYCVYCDSMFYKDKQVAVVGGGDTAFEDAIYLSSLSKKVYLFATKIKAKQKLKEEIKNKNIELIEEEIKSCDENNFTLITKTNRYKIDGLFVAIGQIPNTELLDNIKLDEKGYVKVNNLMRTNISGVYACGDVISLKYKQITIAMGTATIASLNCLEWLNKN